MSNQPSFSNVGFC